MIKRNEYCKILLLNSYEVCLCAASCLNSFRTNKTTMKKITLFLIPFAFILLTAKTCNTGYTLDKKIEGVQFGYKWAEAKNDEGEKAPAVLLLVDNQNTSDIHYSLSLDLYYEGLLRETADLSYCVPALKARKGKLNGVYLISEKFTSEQIKSIDFLLEFNEVKISPIETCKE